MHRIHFQLKKPPAIADPGIINQNIQMPMFVSDLIKSLVNSRCISNIEGQWCGQTTDSSDSRNSAMEFIKISSIYQDQGPSSGKGFSNFQP